MAKYRIVERNGQFYWEKKLFLWEWYQTMWGHETVEKATEAAQRDAALDEKGKVVAELGHLP